MSTPTSHVSQRDQMKARMATESPSEVLSGFAAAANRLDALDFAGRAPQLGYYKASFNEVPEIRGYLAPYSERVDLIVDEDLQGTASGAAGAAGGLRPAGGLMPGVDQSRSAVRTTAS
jgi:hypothetical protein